MRSTSFVSGSRGKKHARIPAHVATDSKVAAQSDVLRDGVFQVRVYYQFGQELGPLIPVLSRVHIEVV